MKADSNQKFDQDRTGKILFLVELLTDGELGLLINQLQKLQIKRNQLRGDNQDTVQL